MKSITTFVGLDAAKASIAVAVTDSGQAPPRYLGAISNTPEAVRKLMKQLGKPEALVMCHEARPTGYGLQRFLCELGVRRLVVAPSLTPVRPGDLVKTDRRDALRLAQLLRAGELTAVWVRGKKTKHCGIRGELEGLPSVDTAQSWLQSGVDHAPDEGA